MRVVYISHSAVVPTYHTFFSPLAASPDIDFVLITPERYKEAGHITMAYQGDGNYQVVALPVVFGKSGRQNLHFYKRLYPVLWHFQRYLYPRLTQWTLRRIDHLCTGTREGEAIFRALGYAGPITYLPHHAIDTKQFFPYPSAQRRALKAKFVGDPDTVAIGYVGRLWSLKGIDLLIQALAMLRSLPWQAVLVGSGRDEHWLRQMVEEVGLAHRIRFLGAYPPERMPDVMNALDVLVLPSRTTREGKEQFGRVLIEAMACRTAVIGSARGYHRVLQHFSGEAIARKIRALYETMLMEHERTGGANRA